MPDCAVARIDGPWSANESGAITLAAVERSPSAASCSPLTEQPRHPALALSFLVTCEAPPVMLTQEPGVPPPPLSSPAPPPPRHEPRSAQPKASDQPRSFAKSMEIPRARKRARHPWTRRH